MSKKKNKLKWASDDLHLMVAVGKCEVDPLELGEILVNLFHYEKQITSYTCFVRTFARLVGMGIIVVEEGKFLQNNDFFNWFDKYNVPAKDQWHRKNEIVDDLNKNYFITKDLLKITPRRLITVFEFEDGIVKLYDYINIHEPNKKIPRLSDEEGLFIEQYSNDPTYGYSEDNPIKVGGHKLFGSLLIDLYLYSLHGYDNEQITHKTMSIHKKIYKSISHNELGIIEEVAVWYQDELEPQFLYFNTYDCELPLKAPMGFIIKEPDYFPEY